MSTILETGSVLGLLGSLTAGGGHEGVKTFLGLPYPVWQAANLILFLFLLVYFLKKPLLQALASRRQEVEETNRKAEENAQKAEELVKKLSARLSELETEVAQLRELAVKNTAVEEADIQRQAEEEARRIAERATLDIENRVRAARKELTLFAGNLAVDLAGQMLSRNLTPDDQKRLIEEGLANLEKGAGTARPN